MRSEPVISVLGPELEILSGFAFPSESFHDVEGLPLVRIRDLASASTEVRFRGRYDDRYVVRDGDVLVGMDGDFLAVRWSGGLSLLNQRVCRLEARKGGKLDQGYLFHLLQPKLDEIHRRTPQTTVRHLSTKVVGQIRHALPNLPEQHRIATLLDTLDEAIRRTEQVIEKLKQMEQGLLHDLLTRGIDDNGGLRPPREEAPHLYKESALGWIPKGWDAPNLRDLFSEPSRNGLYKPSQFHGRGPLMVQMGGIFKGADVEFVEDSRVDVSAIELRTFGLRTGDLLFGRRSLVLEGAGKCALVRCLPEAATFESSIVRVRVDRERLRPEFASLYLGSVPSYLDRRKYIRQVAVSGVSAGDIAQFVVAKPPVAEQDAAIALVNAAIFRIQGETTEVAKLRTLKHGLMDDLLTGRVRTTPTSED